MGMTTDDDDDDGRHERGHAKIAVPRAQEELTALYKRHRDGWLQLSQDSPPDEGLPSELPVSAMPFGGQF